jgi:hypothetical protein
MTKLSRRDAANIAAWRQGIPTTQAGVDKMWTGIVARHNASLPARAQPDLNATPSPRPASRARQSQSEPDSMWAGIAMGLNEQAGLPTPARRSAR